MTASRAKSAAPPYACLMWADELNVYAQIAGTNGPYVARFSRSEGGVAQALHHMGAMHIEHSGVPFHRAEIPPKALTVKGLTQNDREAARDVLKKIGIIS